MSKLMKFLFISIGTWVVLTVLICAIPHQLFVVRGLYSLLCLPIGIVLLIISLIALFKEKKKSLSLLAIIFLFVLPWYSAKMMIGWGAWIHFHLNRGHFESVVKKVLATEDEEERKKICGEECWIRNESPLQIAFHYSHGFYNWQDIVYDPTGRSTQPELPNYGSLVTSDRLSDEWYLCYYSD